MRKIIDLTNKTFGKLTVVGISSERKRGRISWDCLCSCGKQHIAAGADLRCGDCKSCGCDKFNGIPKDITGIKKDKLTAIKSTDVKTNNGDYVWQFMCDCGNIREMSLGSFSSNNNLCCKVCAKKNVILSKTTHGLSKKNKTYNAWCRIKERCLNQNSKDYSNYGGKGIKIDSTFENDFLAFYKEVGDSPDNEQRWSVDRIDYTRNYEPGNLRWATDNQQARNKGKMKNNTSGFTGVVWEDKIHPDKINSTCYAVSQWKEYRLGMQLQKKKSFSVKKLGLLEAFAKACAHRDSKIKELNKLGYGYSDNHCK